MTVCWPPDSDTRNPGDQAEVSALSLVGGAQAWSQSPFPRLPGPDLGEEALWAEAPHCRSDGGQRQEHGEKEPGMAGRLPCPPDGGQRRGDRLPPPPSP